MFLTFFGLWNGGNDEKFVGCILYLSKNWFSFRDEYSRVVDMWNKVREEAVTVCVNNFLLPVFEREAHERLLQEARDYVIKVRSFRFLLDYGVIVT